MIASSAERRRGPAAEWLDWLIRLVSDELAPRPRRFATAVRFAVIGSLGAGLMAACHVDNALGPYVLWLLLGAVPMISLRTALRFLAAEGVLLALSVPIAGMLVDAPWLMLAAIAAFTILVTRLTIVWKLGAFGLALEVVTLDSFYGITFAPTDFGWAVAAVFGGSVIAMLMLWVFDRWLWPAPAEAVLIESLAASARRMRARLQNAIRYYLAEPGAERPPNPPASSEMPAQLALLERAGAEGISPERRAILLAAITRSARIHIEVDRIIVAVRESAPHYVRDLLRTETETAAAAIGDALEEIAHEATIQIRSGPDQPPSPAAARVRPALDALDARIAAVRPNYIGRASIAELSILGSVSESFQAMGRLLERPLDEPPRPGAAATLPAAHARERAKADPALTPYCMKVALCIVAGYVVGLFSQRAEFTVILTTIIITALPTYGAALRKMILRLAGTALGAAVVIVTIIVVTPNFETLPVYMLAIFIVLFISGYASLASGRTAYAGKSIGTTFLLVFAGLSPSVDIYAPLWRIWGILIGTLIVTVVFFLLWPEYAGDSLLPRLRRVLRDTLALSPGGVAAASEAQIRTVSIEISHLLSEVLEVADDARLEGRRSLIDHDAVVGAAGTLRRIAHRLASIAISRIDAPVPPLDLETEAARAAVLAAIRARLEAWLALYEGPQALHAHAAHAMAAAHARAEIADPLERFSSQLAAGSFALMSGWTLEERRRILAELQSLRRLEFVMFEFDRYAAAIPGAAFVPALAAALQASTS